MPTDQREHILNVAIDLFAVRGFHGTSVRTISTAAGVNVAMVNYYFGTKVKLLEAVFERFFSALRGALQNALPAPPADTSHGDRFPGSLVQARLSRIPALIVPVIRQNERCFRVVLREMILQHPDHQALCTRYIQSFLPLLYGPLYDSFLAAAHHGEALRVGPGGMRLDIAGPAMGGMIFSHFLLGFVIPRVTGLEYGEEFFREYESTLSRMIAAVLGGPAPAPAAADAPPEVSP